MAMELYVLSDHRLATMAAWQQAIDADGTPLRLSTEQPFARLNGVLPAEWRGKQTAFECVHWDADELMTELSDIDFGHRWKHVLALRMTSKPYEVIAAYAGGAAYARATSGIVFDCEEGKIISPQRAGEIARELEESIPMVEAALRKVVEGFRK